MNYYKQYDAEQNLICNWNLGAISECGFVLMAGIQEPGEWWGATNEKILGEEVGQELNKRILEQGCETWFENCGLGIYIHKIDCKKGGRECNISNQVAS